MQDRVANNPKVAYAWNSVVAEVLGEKQDGHQVLTGVKLQVDHGQFDAGPEDRRSVPGHRSRSQHGDFQGPARHDARWLSAQSHRAGLEGDRGRPRLARKPAQLRYGDECRRGLRLRRRRRHPLSPGHHRGRFRLRGRHGLREVAGIERVGVRTPLSCPGRHAFRLNQSRNQTIMHRCRCLVSRNTAGVPSGRHPPELLANSRYNS